MSQVIHPTAIIEKGAVLEDNVQVGPYCVIGSKVTLKEGTRLQSHVVVKGRTEIGKSNIIFPFASLGQDSPDRKYKGEDASLVIGDNNDIREYVTMHIGTGEGRGETRVGSHNLFMALSHVAHDCIIGDHCIFANGANLAGHVEVNDHAILGGLSGIHQHVRIGSYAIIGGHSGVDKDVPPYANVSGKRARLGGLNLVGLRRRGVDRSIIKALQQAYNHLFDESVESFSNRVESLANQENTSEVLELLNFVQNAQRGITRKE